MWSNAVLLCISCYASFIKGAAILDNGLGVSKLESRILNIPLETLPSNLPSQTQINDEAFSPLDIWRNADDNTKKNILSDFLKDLPVLKDRINAETSAIADKRYQFGFMGSRGKRTHDDYVSSETFLNSIRPGFQRALSPLLKLHQVHLSQELSNNKRQPNFGFHAVRG